MWIFKPVPQGSKLSQQRVTAREIGARLHENEAKCTVKVAITHFLIRGSTTDALSVSLRYLRPAKCLA